MTIKQIRRAQLVKGGDIIKQGETFTLGFQFFDANDRIIQLGSSDVVTVKIANKTGVIKELSASKVEDRIEFSINENIGHGEMRVEFTVTNGTNVQKYPAGDWIRLNITPSLDDVGTGNVYAITATQMFSRIEGAETKATSAEVRSISAETTATNVQRDFDQILAEAGDSNPEIVAARLGEENLRVFNEKTIALLEETGEDLKRRSVDVVSYSHLIPNKSDPVNQWDWTEAFRAASLDAPDESYTVIIPAGEFFITDTILFYCNVDCKGIIIVPNNVDKHMIVFPRGEHLTVSGSDFLNSLTKGDLTINVKNSPLPQLFQLYNYYFHISSTEVLITRVGDEKFTPYTKNEAGEFKRFTGTKIIAKTPIIHTYNDLSKVSVVLSKKLNPLIIDGLKIRRIGGGDNQIKQRLLVIARNNVKIKNLFIDNESMQSVSQGLSLSSTCGIEIDEPVIKNIVGSGDTYALFNYNSAFITIRRYRYEHSGTESDRGYSGRHGNYVTFERCEMYGVDDHWGHNYEIYKSKFTNAGISFAGSNLNIVDTIFYDCFNAIRIRADTPFAEGDLNIINCEFVKCVRPFFYNVNIDPLGRTPGSTLKIFDKVLIKDCKTRQSFENTLDTVPINSTTYGNRGFFFTTASGGVYNGEFLIGEIKIINPDFDIQFIRLHENYQTKIGKIIIEGGEVPTYKELAIGIFGGSVRTYGKQVVKEIVIRGTKNASPYMTAIGADVPKVEKIEHIDCVFDTDLLNTRIEATEPIEVKFKDCLIQEKRNFNFFNGLLTLKDNTFKGNLGLIFTSSTGILVSSNGNKAGIEINDGRLPILNGYVNPSYFKQ